MKSKIRCIKRNSYHLIQKNLQCNFTIEVALLMPVLILVQLVSVYLSFYVYDALIISQSAYQAGLRGQQMKNASNEEVAEQIEIELCKLLNDNVLAMERLAWEIDVGLTEIEISITGKILFPWKGLGLEANSEENWNLKHNIKLSRIKAIDIIRIFKKMERD